MGGRIGNIGGETNVKTTTIHALDCNPLGLFLRFVLFRDLVNTRLVNMNDFEHMFDAPIED